jgi:hypothetical protein
VLIPKINDGGGWRGEELRVGMAWVERGGRMGMERRRVVKVKSRENCGKEKKPVGH